MAFSKAELLDMIEDSKTDEFPGGIACELWKSLNDEYRPSTTVGAAKQLSELMALKLGPKEDPKKFGNRMATVLNKYGTKVDDKQKVAVVVQALGKRYAKTIRQETKDIKSAESREPTAKELIKACSEEWVISGGNHETEETPTETSLANTSTSGGSCYNCGERGHKANNCPKPRQKYGYASDRNVKCHHCGKFGHIERNCWDKPENKDKRPNWWNEKNSESGNASIELVIANVEQPSAEDDVREFQLTSVEDSIVELSVAECFGSEEIEVEVEVESKVVGSSDVKNVQAVSFGSDVKVVGSSVSENVKTVSCGSKVKKSEEVQAVSCGSPVK